MTTETTQKVRHFIRTIVEDDLKAGKNDGKLVTRFPPEPNGYLHIGHAKSICLNFGLAEEYGGVCYLRFDDTNPCKEEVEFMEAIKADVQWLGFDWGDRLTHAAYYFDQLYDYAVELVKQGKAFVCSLSADEIREYRGTLTAPGKECPYRNRSIEENLDLFARMKAGEFEEGEHVLRAKIDMSSGNINMRDPVIFRIRHVAHHHTGEDWCMYPMYDFTHCLSDAIEGITHSLCTLEFQDHRPLYDWFIEQLDTPCHPQQIEFSRLNLSHTITSKRKLKILVDKCYVEGWDDPRMPTLIGMRRRGVPPVAIRQLCEMIGVSKSESVIEMDVLDECIRHELNQKASRAMCVLNPLRVVIENYPEDKIETIDAACHPNDESFGRRELPFSREIIIDRGDFMEEPPSKFFRLAPGKEVRLRNAYVIKCEKVIKDEKTGEITELRCTYDPDTLGKKPEGRKVKGVIHWLSVEHAKRADVRLYDRLFTVENPAQEDDFTHHINPHSLTVIQNAYIEPSLVNAKPDQRFQFERVGYFCVDEKDSTKDHIIFNRIIGLRS